MKRYFYKYRYTIALCIVFILNFNVVSGQILIGSHELEDFFYDAHVKSLDEFIQRFNGREFSPIVQINDTNRIRTNRLLLFDSDIMKDIKLIGNDGAVFNPADNAACIALGSGNAGISTEDSDNDGVGLLIANFTFTGLGFRISTSGPNTYNDVVIQGCDFSGAEKQNAIRIYNYTNPEFINDVTVEGCSFSTYESAVLMFELNNATVRDNTFRNVEFGVNFSGAANKTGTLLIEDNISIGNTNISEWGGNAFVVQGPDNATIILRGNRIYDHEPESILYVANGYGSPKLTAEDNIYYSSEGSTAGIKLQEVSNEDISQVANGGSLTIKKDGTIKRSWTT